MTKIINIFGASGSGKSTLAMGLTYALKLQGFKAELVTEYAKSIVLEESFKKLNFQYYVFAKQLKSIDVVLNKGLDYIVTDSPLFLSLFYGTKYNTLIPYLSDLILDQFNSMENINIFLNRAHDFDSFGRVQNEVESDEDSLVLKSMLIENNIQFLEFKTSLNNSETLNNVLNSILYKT